MVGPCAVSRMPLRMVASTELSATSGSKADIAEMPVRKASIGWLAFTKSKTWMTSSGMRRFALRVMSNSWSCWLVGRAPYSNR